MSFVRAVFQRTATVVAQPVHRTGPTAPLAPWFFAAGMAASLSIAIFGGLLFGAFAATESGISRGRWTETVQAHGDLQLFGWVAVFISILTFEFIIRVNARGAPLPLVGRLVVVASFAGGALLSAAGKVWNEEIGVAWPIGAGLIALGSIVFVWLVFTVRPANPVQKDPHSLWFRSASLWLLLAALAGLAGALRASGGIMALPESAFVVELVVRGFVLNSVFAVAIRAVPGHLGLPIIQRRRHGLLWILVNASLIVWLGGSGAFGIADSDWLRQAGNLGLGVTLLLATWWLGMPTLFRHWVAQPYYRAMVPIAWLGLVAYGAALTAAAIFPGWGERDLFAVGGIRHIFMLGFMAPLMVAMSDIVLARFGTGQILAERWIPVAFVLVVISWPLRVVLPLLTNETTMFSHSVYGSAAILATAGLGIMGWVCVKNALAIRRLSLKREGAQSAA